MSAIKIFISRFSMVFLRYLDRKRGQAFESVYPREEMAVDLNYTYFEVNLRGEIIKYLAKTLLVTRKEVYAYCIACDIPVKYYDQIISYQTQPKEKQISDDVIIVHC